MSISRSERRRGLVAPLLLMLLIVSVVALSGCSSSAERRPAGDSRPQAADALPDSAYYVDPTLAKWIDPETGYDTTREWTLDGSKWPVCVIMSPSQSPQFLLGEGEKGLFSSALKPLGVTPEIEKIDIPARTFHALQRSKWPFVYMPYAVFTDYCRTNDNQGGAGGLQYVAIAGSTAGGGYTLITQDPEIKSVADLAGKTVAGLENNPARIVIMRAAAKAAGLSLGDGENDIHYSTGASADDLNGYLAGKYDAAVVLSIVRERFLRTGSHTLTDFTDVGYTPNYTILTVERSVLEERPEVVKAFLEAHYQSQVLLDAEAPGKNNARLMESWNGYFRSQDSTVAAQRMAPDQTAFDLMLGNMHPEQRLDPTLLSDCFEYLDANDAWGWDGSVDASRLLAFELYDEVLKGHDQEPQSAASK
ncbi:MAG: ABC transporter substrate-binding protein [Actinobacteria bacterium]|nr:ABC transporter substrate-binding protein [Actinomycetota bacterium]MCG2806713.1 ABC transporter substrate-binding protein [Coriobacteriia bacterium]